MYIDPFTTAYYRKGGMTGLNLKDPIFLYRKATNGFQQLTHFLYWKENSGQSSYELYATDPISGNKQLVSIGSGLDEYAKLTTVLRSRGINKEDIMWGGELTAFDKKRLNL